MTILENPSIKIAIAALIGLFTLRVALAYVRCRRKAKTGDITDLERSYSTRNSLLTDSESRFYSILKESVEEGVDISCKVRLEDIVQVKRGFSFKEQESLRSRIKSRHIDFVLTKDDGRLISALIELDDPSHDSKKSKAKDDFKDSLAKVAKLRLIRFHVREKLTPEFVHERIHG